MGPRSVCSAEECAELLRVERRAVGQHHRRHHLVADVGRRYPVHRHLDDVGMAQHHPFDRRGAEVLTVDPHPVAEPAREVRVAVLVAVGQITAVVRPAAHPLGIGLRIVVVTLETPCVRGVHQLAGDAGRARLAGLDIEDLGAFGQRARALPAECPVCGRSRYRPRSNRSRPSPGCRTGGRTSRRRQVRPRCRRPRAADCRHRRAAREWRAHTTSGLPT